MKKFLMIDGSSLTFRAFYAIRNLSTQDGISTNAVYGFLSMFYSAMEKINPDYVFVAFDKKGPTFRTEEYKEYKGTREKAPEELNPQFGILTDILDAMNIKHLSMDKYEADDIIGTLSKNWDGENLEKYLLTGDRDYFQLIDDNTKVLYTVKGISNLKIFDKNIIKEQYGISPKQLIDVKGLMGDTSDNIPGVPGIGEKRALDLIKEYGSIEGVYENIDKITAKKTKENLVDNEDLAYLSKRLGTIYRDIDLDTDILSYEIKNPDKEKLAEIFTRLEFKGYLDKLGLEREVKKLELDYEIVKDSFDIDLGDEIYFKSFFETDKYIHSDIKYLAIKGKEKTVYIFNKDNVHLLKDIFESDKKKYSFDIKEDIVLLNKVGIEIADEYKDIMMMEYLIDPSRTTYTIQSLLNKYLNLDINTEEEVFGKGAKKKGLDEIPKKDLYEYIATEIISLENIKDTVEEKLAELNMQKLYEEIENEVIKILANMEIVGVQLDDDILNELDGEFSKRIENLQDKIYTEAGESFNINSPKQLGEILFNKLKYPVIKKNKSGYSTSQEVLEKLLDAGDIPGFVLEYRSLTKLKSTYIDGLRDSADSDGRIRSTFRQNNTATGRLSSQDPNLQNIPIRTDEGRLIRKAFVAKEGYKLVDADYSQIELRLLAHLANDKNMIKAFENDLDIHASTAAEVFHVDIKDVTSAQRSDAKAVNFGIIYGISSFGLSQNLGISRKQAQEYIDKYMASYPEIDKYMEDIVKDAKKKGFVETITHRRRMIPELNSKNKNVRGFGERIALNTPIQGSAADIIKIAMINVYEELNRRQLDSKLILQIHDELIIEAKEDEVEEVIELMRNEMENTIKLRVPLKVDIKVGDTWYETH